MIRPLLMLHDAGKSAYFNSNNLISLLIN